MTVRPIYSRLHYYHNQPVNRNNWCWNMNKLETNFTQLNRYLTFHIEACFARKFKSKLFFAKNKVLFSHGASISKFIWASREVKYLFRFLWLLDVKGLGHF